MEVVSALNGPESEQTMRFYPLVKRLKSDDSSVAIQEQGGWCQTLARQPLTFE